MEDDMAAMFPNGIRTLIVDDDAKFLKSATKLLSFLNFDVVVCSNVAHALKSLKTGDLKGFDVILVHAAKAAACGFDFRAIVEADLLIPVIYFLPQDHEATGDKADELLHALQAGTYVIKKPLDANEVRSLLWKVIAFRKCELETKARRGGAAADFGLGVQGEDEGRVHFKVVKGGGRKRKGNGSNPGGSSASTATAAAAGGHPAAKGKEKDNVASLQQPAQQEKHGRGKKAQKNGGGEAFKLLQPNKAIIMNGPQLNQHQPKPSLFVHPVFRTLGVPRYNPNFFMNAAVPPYNPNFFSDADGPSSNGGTFAGAVYSAAPSALPPAARQQQKQQPVAHSIIFGDNMPPAAAPTMAAASATYEPQFSQVIGNQQQPPDVHPLLVFGPFPYQGSSPLAAEGGLFTGGMAGGASAAAAAEAAAYGNEVSLSFLQPPNLGAEQDADGELADPAMAPQPVSGAIDSATMEWLLSDDFDDYVGGSPLVAPNNQVPGMALNVDEPTAMAGGALGSSTNAASSIAPHQDLVAMPDGGTTNAASFTAMPNGGSSNAASFMASNVGDLRMAGGAFGNGSSAPSMAPHQDHGAAPNNGDQLAMGNNIHGSLMGSQGQEGPGAAMDGDDAGLTAAMMPPPDQYEDNTSSPHDALLGDLHGPMFEFDGVVDLDVLLGGLTDGGAAAAADDEASLIASEEGGSSMDGLGNLDGLKIPYDLLNYFLFAHHKNENSVRE